MSFCPICCSPFAQPIRSLLLTELTQCIVRSFSRATAAASTDKGALQLLFDFLFCAKIVEDIWNNHDGDEHAQRLQSSVKEIKEQIIGRVSMCSEFQMELEMTEVYT